MKQKTLKFHLDIDIHKRDLNIASWESFKWLVTIDSEKSCHTVWWLPGDLGDNIEIILSLSRSYVNSPQQPERLRSAKEPGSREGGPGVAPGGPSMATFQSETGNCVTMEPALDLLRLWNGTPIDENHGGLSMCTPSFCFFFWGGLCFFQPRNPGVPALKKKKVEMENLLDLHLCFHLKPNLALRGSVGGELTWAEVTLGPRRKGNQRSR